MRVKVFYTGEQKKDDNLFIDPETKLYADIPNVTEIIDNKGDFQIFGSTKENILRSFDMRFFKLEVTM